MDRLTAASVFVRIAECGSMAAAADALGMSRAMVTRYLASMEAWAGARLLHRTTRRLSLTPAGEQALVRCRRLLEAGAAVPVSDEGGDPVRGLLRVACAQSLAQDVLAPAVAVFLRRHPRVVIDLSIDARTVNLVEARIDLALRITNDLDPGLVARRLGSCPSVVCATPSYLAAHGTPRAPAELAGHNCLAYSYFGRGEWRFSDPDGKPVAVAVGGNLSANESHVLLAAALEGAGIVMQPAYAVRGPLADGRLVALLPDFAPPTLGVHAVFQTHRQMSPALRALLDFLADWFAGAGGAKW